MSRRKRFELNKNHGGTFGLNITSMTDMFTILLVFLLQTYSTADIQVIPEQGQSLPVSNVDANPVMSVQISVTKEVLKIEDRVIASLSNLDFTGKDIDSNDPNFIKPLFEELDKLAKQEKKKDDDFQAGTSTVKPNPGVLDGKILVKADQHLSYGVLRKVMYTASMAGFPKMKMATVVGN
jgi:biopolymer transport protein ExbD